MQCTTTPILPIDGVVMKNQVGPIAVGQLDGAVAQNPWIVLELGHDCRIGLLERLNIYLGSSLSKEANETSILVSPKTLLVANESSANQTILLPGHPLMGDYFSYTELRLAEKLDHVVKHGLQHRNVTVD
jgi:hypothetical protein